MLHLLDSWNESWNFSRKRSFVTSMAHPILAEIEFNTTHKIRIHIDHDISWLPQIDYQFVYGGIPRMTELLLFRVLALFFLSLICALFYKKFWLPVVRGKRNRFFSASFLSIVRVAIFVICLYWAKIVFFDIDGEKKPDTAGRDSSLLSMMIFSTTLLFLRILNRSIAWERDVWFSAVQQNIALISFVLTDVTAVNSMNLSSLLF